jgi:3-mercaptopyruvate sulfurtransferase SseA
MKELLGFEEVKNYDGSWAEWIHFKMPVEKNKNE